VRYGDVVALDDCSLTVPPGRVLGLLGPNGAGKTTAMRCIFGLVAPDRGEVSWRGAPIDHQARLRFGYMPEERGLYPHTRVMELLVCRVQPRDLLAGKVLGIGVVGLGQMLLALLAGVAAIIALDTIDVPAAVPAALASAVLWFALGYAFWSVALAAVGALVSRVEDLQAAVAPLTWTMTLCALTAPVAAESPDAWYSRVASLLPITAPFTMPVRIAVGDVPAWEIMLAVSIILAATLGLVRLGGAVYSGSLLRTGARPRLGDVWRAARAREGP
jgi:ABC-2 type transport system permease protein